MEEVILRFPLLGRQIFEKLNNQSLVKCRIIGKTWKCFIDNEKFLTFAIIKRGSNASDKSIWRRLRIQTKEQSNFFMIGLLKLYHEIPKASYYIGVQLKRDAIHKPFVNGVTLKEQNLSKKCIYSFELILCMFRRFIYFHRGIVSL